MKKILYKTIFAISLATINIQAENNYFHDSCTYKRENISYRENQSFDNTIAFHVYIQSKEGGVCQPVKFDFEISSKKALLTRETDLLSFLLDEYLAYSQQIISSSKIASKYLNISAIIAIQNKQKKEIEEQIKKLGFDLTLFKSFAEDIANKIAPLDIYCLDIFTVYYKYELDKLNIFNDYSMLFDEYKLQTDISENIFKSIVNTRIEYLEVLKKIILTTLADKL